MSNECSIIGSSMVHNDVQIPLAIVANKIDDQSLREIASRWAKFETCRISRKLWPYKLLERTQNLLPFNKGSKDPSRFHYAILEMTSATVQSYEKVDCFFSACSYCRILECSRDVPLINLIRFAKSTSGSYASSFLHHIFHILQQSLH